MSEKIKKSATNEERIAFLNSKAEEESDLQEQELVTDYDAALREYKTKNTPHKVRFKGNIYEVPPTMPFSFSMFYMRYCIVKENGKTIFKIPDERVSDFIERMFGKRFLAALSKSDDVDLNFIIGTIVPDVFEKWGYGIKKPVKNVQTPES